MVALQTLAVAFCLCVLTSLLTWKIATTETIAFRIHELAEDSRIRRGVFLLGLGPALYLFSTYHTMWAKEGATTMTTTQANSQLAALLWLPAIGLLSIYIHFQLISIYQHYRTYPPIRETGFVNRWWARYKRWSYAVQTHCITLSVTAMLTGVLAIGGWLLAIPNEIALGAAVYFLLVSMVCNTGSRSIDYSEEKQLIHTESVLPEADSKTIKQSDEK